MPFARISAAFSMKPDRWLSEQVGVNAASYPRRGPWSRRSLSRPAAGGRAVCLRPESPSRSSLQRVSNRDPTSSHPGVTTPGARESGSADRGFESSRPDDLLPQFQCVRHPDRGPKARASRLSLCLPGLSSRAWTRSGAWVPLVQFRAASPPLSGSSPRCCGLRVCGNGNARMKEQYEANRMSFRSKLSTII